MSIEPIVIIPARMGASRLPGKPLADIGGVPMIVRVARQALHAAVLGFVHPISRESLRFEVPPPADFARALESLRALESVRALR